MSVIKGEDWIPPGLLPRLSTSLRCHNHPLLPHIMSQVSTHSCPIHNQSRPYQDILHTEVHVCHLQIRIVSQGVVCVHSVYLGPTLACFLGLFVPSSSRFHSIYHESFCVYHLPKRHMRGSSKASLFIIFSKASLFIIVSV